MFEFKYYILIALTSFTVFCLSYYFFTKMYLKRKYIYILTNPYLIVIYSIFGIASYLFVLISILFNFLHFFENSSRESNFKVTASNVYFIDKAIESSSNTFSKEKLIETREEIIKRAENNTPYDYMEKNRKIFREVKAVEPTAYSEIKNKATKALENIGG